MFIQPNNFIRMNAYIDHELELGGKYYIVQ